MPPECLLETFWEHILACAPEMLPNVLLEAVWEHILAWASEMLPNDVLETIWAYIMTCPQKCFQMTLWRLPRLIV